jgi:hypothetical protein
VSPELIGLLFAGLALYSFFFVRRAADVQQTWLLPFLYRIHAPNVLETLTDDEHESIHDQIDGFNVRILLVFAAAVIATGSMLLFLLLLFNGGDPTVAGYITSFAFAFVGANYDLNTKIIQWVSASENELLARVLQNKADAGGFDTLGEYLQAENDKMFEEAFEEMNRIADEFMEVAEEIGFDPDKDYEESEETIEEFYSIMDQAQEIMCEKYPDHINPVEK